MHKLRITAKRININFTLLRFNDADILAHKGTVTAEIEKAFAESEFEKYRVIQDRLYESDFDKMIRMITAETERN